VQLLHTLSKAIQAQMIGLPLYMNFGKVLIAIQNKILTRIFGKRTRNDEAIAIHNIANHVNMSVG
jgi:hypothetical protein